jgi:signal transduction histidine kinase
MRLKNSLTMKFMLAMAMVITTVMMMNLIWSIKQYQRQAEGEMKEKSAVIAQQFLATRSFISLNQDAINSDSIGNYEFKHLNPAAVGKGVSDIFSKYSGYKMKQTNLQVRDLENTPDNFEIVAMKNMAEDPDLTEVWGYENQGGVQVFRYLTSLHYDQSCMTCHGGPVGQKDISGYLKEGHSIGDFAGAISIVVPMTAFLANQNANIITSVSFLVIMVLASMGLVYLVMEHIVVMPIRELTGKVREVGRGDLSSQLTDIHTYDEMRDLAEEFNGMAGKLQLLYNSLETKVDERTRQLYNANDQLAQQGRELMEINIRLTETNRLKSEFLAVMSHELRTPLTAIIAFAEILLTEGDSLSSQQREYLEDIFESGHQLLSQISDILDLSKIEAGLIRVSYQEVDIREVIESIMRTVAPLVAKKQLNCTIEILPDLPLVAADYDKIKHIIRNLVSNAIKFTPVGGNIKVVAGLSWQDGKIGSLLVSVQDTGIGISPDEQESIFEKFVQGNHSDQREYSGSGIGLSLAKHLVELHEGRIWVESQIGRGSAFSFMLPLSGREC